ncbi:MAG: alkaline phosphatase [Pirellulaceae bacterium]
MRSFNSLTSAFSVGLTCLLLPTLVGEEPKIGKPQTLDPIAKLQAEAAATNQATWGHWGPATDKYSSWTTHSNRLIPIYTFGWKLDSVCGENSIYRSPEKLTEVYGFLPTATVNPTADYCDQTDIYRLQQAAIAAGKKRIILFIFDGMDWQSTRAAAIAKTGEVQYDQGRGRGLAFQDYRGVETDFGAMVTSPHNNGTNVNVNKQTVLNPGGSTPGGYDVTRAGATAWAEFPDPLYPNASLESNNHAYTDSSSSATSMTSGIKTYNNGVNVDFSGREVVPLARVLQDDGFAVGVVTSVPISHATPAAAYASNVHRDDYQDLTRDMLGLPSIYHPGGLSGLDVIIGGGWGEPRDKDGAQGDNFVPGNRYLTSEDLAKIDRANGGKYVVAQRTHGRTGEDVLDEAVKQAIAGKHRLLGYFGVTGGHLPFRTADGRYDPVASIGNATTAKAEEYSRDDVAENVSLSRMAVSAVEVLDARSDRWWLMIEAGDVDWANHSNNIDNSIGAVLSGDEAFAELTQWIENHGGWDETCLFLTADHGHYLILDKPEALTGVSPTN